MLKNYKFSLIVLGIIIVTAIVLRIMSPEDNWICQKGDWVKHGNPRAAKPTELCPGAVAPEVLNTEIKATTSNNDNLVGNDRDEHGCIGSAGYSWCEAKQKCLRIWEEACTSATSTSVIEPKVVKPQPNEIIKSPYEISGLAPGNWFFEASMPIKLITNDNLEIMATSAQALSDWMTTDFVPFSANLIFTTRATSGYLLISKDNPSGLPQNAGEYRIPVRFK